MNEAMNQFEPLSRDVVSIRGQRQRPKRKPVEPRVVVHGTFALGALFLVLLFLLLPPL